MFDSTDYRLPTDEEAAGVAADVYYHCKGNIRWYKFLFWVISIIGALGVVGSLGQELESWWAKLLMTALMFGFFFFIAWMLYKGYKELEAIVDVYATGQFYVVDGYVSRTEEYVGWRNKIYVGFTSKSGKTIDGTCAVPARGVEVGTPLLLVYIDESFKLPVKEVMTAYTPAMLAGEVHG